MVLSFRVQVGASAYLRTQAIEGTLAILACLEFVTATLRFRRVMTGLMALKAPGASRRPLPR